MLLVKGNSKLGRKIWGFSLPAGSTCPGKSDICNDRCYAQKGFFVMPSAKAAFKKRLAATKRDDFVLAMTAEIAKVRAEIVRIHISGDMYDAEYAHKWYEIVKASPATVFFMYTRSWRVDEIRPELAKIAALPNMRMWWSVDQETGMPTKLPKRVRTAYMAITINDAPPKKAHLAFRDYPVRGLIQKKMNDVLVCPPENGVNTGMTCEQCGNCWRRPPEDAINSKRIALKLVN
jgi:hypothetical protein